MQNWFSKLMGSIKGILIGLILLIVSIGVLFWNEGRIDLSNIANTSIEISASQQSTEAEDKLVSVSGKVTTEQQLGDTYLQTGNYIAINRNVEMYAWTEKSQTKSQKTNGENYVDTDKNKNAEAEKTYIYEKEWKSSPTNSDSFQFPAQHQNPTKAVKNKTIRATNAKIGIYELDTKSINLPGYTEITLTEENTIINKGTLTEDEDLGTSYFENFEDIAPTLENNKYIFKGFGTLETPEIGDIRISYSVVEANQDVTVFGHLNSTKISTYIAEKNSKLYRMFSSTRNEALSTMTTEHTTSTWGLRLLGFILMWVGLGMLLGPISAILDFVPLAGSLSRSVIGIATFIIAAILSTIIIWISMILHNLIAVIVIVVVLVGGGVWYLSNKGQKTTATHATKRSAPESETNSSKKR